MRRKVFRTFSRFFHCGTCQAQTRHGVKVDPCGFKMAVCRMCRTPNEWVG